MVPPNVRMLLMSGILHRITRTIEFWMVMLVLLILFLWFSLSILSMDIIIRSNSISTRPYYLECRMYWPCIINGILMWILEESHRFRLVNFPARSGLDGTWRSVSIMSHTRAIYIHKWLWVTQTALTCWLCFHHCSRNLMWRNHTADQSSTTGKGSL
jgi:hypothetical protein